MTERIRITSGDGIPSAWGTPRLAQRKTTVAVREPAGVEVFDQPWGRLTARPGEDWVVTEESGNEYPIKKDIFARTYEAAGPGRYRKAVRSRLVQVPKGWVAVLATLEGEVEVIHPDFVAIGADHEVYANSQAWVQANLDFLS